MSTRLVGERPAEQTGAKIILQVGHRLRARGRGGPTLGAGLGSRRRLGSDRRSGDGGRSPEVRTEEGEATLRPLRLAGESDASPETRRRSSQARLAHPAHGPTAPNAGLTNDETSSSLGLMRAGSSLALLRF